MRTWVLDLGSSIAIFVELYVKMCLWFSMFVLKNQDSKMDIYPKLV